MTKKEIKASLIKYVHRDNEDAIYKIVDEFFDSNVVIPKGGTLQSKIGEKWEDIFIPSSSEEYRIKPIEPIYEYLYVLPVDTDPLAVWATEDSASHHLLEPWYRTETKRIKQ